LPKLLEQHRLETVKRKQLRAKQVKMMQGNTFRPHAMVHHVSEMAEKNIHRLEALGTRADPIERLRLLCLNKGPTGILSLGRMFRRLDDEGNKQLTHDQFIKGIRDAGVEMTHEEANELFEIFDDDNSGVINMGEFLVELRPPVPESRQKVIDEAFNKIAKTGEGVVSLDELKHIYNVKTQTPYLTGEQSEEKMLKEFMVNFEEGAAEDGMLTHEEFVNYYSALSASIDSDCGFDLMMRQAFKL